ncbi:glycosyltransferase family 2 protein [Aquisalinus flavus]|nr:glycosyltransferase family 2 protein [Aquisalinus flavus]MBD0428061.1 glycosyltransferase family 2 protein [Aquisalinus flavus]
MSDLEHDSGMQAASTPHGDASVSVIIVSFWTGPLLMRSAMSALRQPHVREVIVVDNGNWADEMDRLRELADYSEKLIIISGHGNIGYAAGCNKGAANATGEYIFILNPDAILPDEAVGDMLAESARLDGGWMLGAKLINPDGTEQAGSRRSTLTPWRAFVEMTKLYNFAPRHPYFRRFNYHKEPCPGQLTEVPVISGACMLMKRETYFSIDGMDANYFLHVEDVDFCLRLARAGGKIYFTPKVDILHFKSSSRESRIRVELRKAKSMVRYFFTHFRDPYPSVFLYVVSALIWLGFAMRTVMIMIRRMLALVGLKQSGPDTVRRGYAAARNRARS